MELRRQSQEKLSGVWLLRLFPQTLAKIDVIINRVPESLLRFGNGLSVKRDHVAGVDDLAPDQTGFRVNGELANIALIFSHGKSHILIRTCEHLRPRPCRLPGSDAAREK